MPFKITILLRDKWAGRDDGDGAALDLTVSDIERDLDRGVIDFGGTELLASGVKEMSEEQVGEYLANVAAAQAGCEESA